MPKFAFTISLIFLLLLSCTKEVNIEIPGYKEQLVVEGRIETNGFPIVLLSKSQNVYASTNLQSYLVSFVSEATVTVSNGNETVELEVFAVNQLPLESQKTIAELLKVELNEVIFLPVPIYSTNNLAMRGEVGKTYSLTIQENGKEYSGKTTLLPPVPLQQVYWKQNIDNTDYGLIIGRLADPPNQYNAYKWEAKRITIQANGEPMDTLFRRAPGSYFDDRFFDGITFEFETYNRQRKKDPTHLDEFKRYYKINDVVVAKFSRLDRDVFEFYNKMNEQQSNMGNPFAVPVNVPSNVSGALGVWAGVSPWYDTVICVP